jgi:hypothetical protein
MHVRDLSPEQKKSGLAAWLGWMFDGLDMHIYTLVATLFVAILVFHPETDGAFRTMDTNGDGQIVAAEWKAGEPIASVDRNKDGFIDRDEYAVFAAKSHTGDNEVKEKSGWIHSSSAGRRAERFSGGSGICWGGPGRFR